MSLIESSVKDIIEESNRICCCCLFTEYNRLSEKCKIFGKLKWDNEEEKAIRHIDCIKEVG